MTDSKVPKKRLKENRSWPKGWRLKNGAIRYRVPVRDQDKWGGKCEVTLGKTEAEAYRVWADKVEFLHKIVTVNDLLDRYAHEVIPQKAISTQELNRLYLKTLRKAFGHMSVNSIEPVHIYQFLDARGKKKEDGRGGVSIAKREAAMFTDAYAKAVKWGYVKTHPWKGEVEYETEKGRDRYIEDWELNCFLSLSPKHKGDPTLVIQAYTGVKILTALRQQDLLSLKVSDFTAEGIRVDIKKTGKPILIEWTENLRSAVDYALSVRPVDLSPYLFCKRKGGSYYDETKPQPSSGWKTIWRRYMERVISETELQNWFTEHDLRAKAASDLNNLEHAQKLLAHSSASMTKRYVRSRQTVKPTR